MKVCVFSFFSLLTLFGICQNRTVVIGKILDQQTLRPIQNVNILYNKKSGTSSDLNGNFSLRISSSVANIIKFSHVSYISKSVPIDVISDTINLEILLQPKVESVDEVVVTESNGPYYKNTEVVLLDYFFVADDIWLVIKKKNTYFLRHLNRNQDYRLSFKFEELYTDCFKNIHLFSKDSAYQIYIIDAHVEIVERVSKNKFNEVLMPCKTSYKDKLVFEAYGYQNQSIQYFSIDKKTGEKEILWRIENKIGNKYASILRNEIISFYMRHKRPDENKITNNIWDGTIKDLELYDRKFFQMVEYYQKIGAKPIYCPLFASRNKIVLFNHIENKIIRTNLVDEQVTKISYTLDKDWDNQILQDNNHNLYLKYSKNGIVTLKKINPENAKILSVTRIPNHVYPEKIKIHNDYIYYVKRNYTTDSFELFKLPINEP